MNLLVCLLVIAITGALVIKKFKAQTVLLLGGLIMMFAAYLLGYTTSFVEAKKSTGVLFFDAFEYINITTAKDAANIIMRPPNNNTVCALNFLITSVPVMAITNKQTNKFIHVPSIYNTILRTFPSLV